MVKLKKAYYDFKELRALEQEGKVKISRLHSLDTFGTSGSGLVARMGIKVETSKETKEYQIKFSSKGYGSVTDKIDWFNGRTKEKYDKYFTRINIWLEGNGLEL